MTVRLPARATPHSFFCLALLLGLIASARSVPAQPFQLPTANRALFEPGGQEKFFAPTAGKTWPSGCFGCVRSDGWQMHEGLDIRCTQRDKRGEPTDPVMATRDGTVAYINAKPSLSNYGNYIILRHDFNGLEIYSTYAHLSQIRPGLKIGDAVKTGETIGTMGRTANTAQAISKDRAHVHFELNLFINERFSTWYKKTFPGQRNDHGLWNGQNMVGLDPQFILIESHRTGAKYDLLRFLQSQPELCRVMVRAKDFPWLKRYSKLVHPNPNLKNDAIAGYEIALNYNGVPFQLIPRSDAEIKTKARVQLLSVNEAERNRNPCRKLVIKKGARWELTNQGLNLVNLLTH